MHLDFFNLQCTMPLHPGHTDPLSKCNRCFHTRQAPESYYSILYPTPRTDIVADKVADMEVDDVADMVVDMKVDKVVDMVVDMEVDKVVDMVADNRKMTLTSTLTWKSNLVSVLVTGAG